MNNQRIKVMTIFGTRPEAIKMAPLVLELKKRTEVFEPIVTVTAQHREMLDQVLDTFGIIPDYDLNIMKDKQTLPQITTRALEGLDEVMKETNPDIVLVHGDTSTTFVASLAAYYNQIAIGRIEAGLRTWDGRSGYPEEMNRQLTVVMADVHLATTEKAKQNRLKENNRADRIVVTGNTATDALQTSVDSEYTNPIIDEIRRKRLVVMTAH